CAPGDMTTDDSSIMASRFVGQAHIQRTLSSRQDAKNAKRLFPFFALLLGALCVCSRPRQSVTPRLAASSKCSDRPQPGCGLLVLRRAGTAQSGCRTDPLSGFACLRCRSRSRCGTALLYVSVSRQWLPGPQLRSGFGSSHLEQEADYPASLVRPRRPRVG